MEEEEEELLRLARTGESVATSADMASKLVIKHSGCQPHIMDRWMAVATPDVFIGAAGKRK